MCGGGHHSKRILYRHGFEGRGAAVWANSYPDRQGNGLVWTTSVNFYPKAAPSPPPLNTVLRERSSTDTLPEKRTLVGKHVTTYKKLSSEFLEYLDHVNTSDSKREAAAHILIRDSTFGLAEAVLCGLDVILRSPSKRHSMSPKSDVSDKFTSVSGQTQSSSTYSLRLKQSMKLQAQKAELRFAQREAILKHAKAEMVFNQSNLDTDFEILDKVKKAAVASAEYQALCQKLGDMSDSDVAVGDISDMPDFQLSNSLLVGTQSTPKYSQLVNPLFPDILQTHSPPAPSVPCDPESEMLVNPLRPDISQTHSPPAPSVPCDPESEMLVNPLRPDISQTHSPPAPRVPCDHESEVLVNPLCPDISQTYSPPAPSILCNYESQMLVNPLWSDVTQTHSQPAPRAPCVPETESLVNPLCPDVSQTYSQPVPSIQCVPVSKKLINPLKPDVNSHSLNPLVTTSYYTLVSDVLSQPVNSLMPSDIHFDAGTVNHVFHILMVLHSLLTHWFRRKPLWVRSL